MGSEPVIVLDTHALVWWLSDSQKLTPVARRTIKAAAASSGVAVSTISLFEIGTLVRRRRLKLAVDVQRWFGAVCALPELTVEPVSAEIAWAAAALDQALPGDPADRIIVATARALEARLVTADAKLRVAAPVETVW
jgi:PIN domain nuclease of toxin-antitoxin system